VVHEIGESCSPPLPLAAGEKMCENLFLANKSLNVKNQNKFYLIFFYIPKGEAFM
jgi:hypothetical protein